MILYFSGTGNSEYVAKKIGREIKDEVANLFDRIKNHDYSEMHSHNPWVIVAPTYAWRIPRILQAWLEKTDLSGSKDIYFVMTCGGNIGNAGKYLIKLCTSKDMNYLGCAPLVMPENYIALFSTPTKDDALKTIELADTELDTIITVLKNNSKFVQPPLTMTDKMNSGIVNDIFYPLFVHAKKFYVDNTCISCEKCEKLCPLNNIHMEKGKPVWGNNCTHCMACICNCPTEAIEYGKNSKGLPRYVCPK